MTERLVNPVHFFNARGFSTMTEDMYLERIRELEAQLVESQENCKILARRLKVIADNRAGAK